MTTYKSFAPGRCYNLCNTVVRAKRSHNGCDGCFFNTPWVCPRVQDLRNFGPCVPCAENQVIFIKP